MFPPDADTDGFPPHLLPALLQFHRSAQQHFYKLFENLMEIGQQC